MGLRRRLLGGGGKLIAGQVLGQACSFGRNVIVARLLTPEDFGIAATFAIAVSLFEMISNLAVDRLLVQADDGDDPIFQATAQAFQVLRGFGIALFTFFLAWPISRLFGIPHALWAFQCVALIPLIRGFTHLDAKRFQRELGFGRDVATELIPQILLVLAAWPFVWWFQDYSAMLWLLVIQAATTVAVSHIVAQRRYTWAWDRQFLRRIYTFGWPLLLNGLLLFLVFQGDRVLIGSAYEIAQLGIYSVAFSITFIPAMMIAKVASALLLPLFSKQQGNAQQFGTLFTFSMYILCLLSVAFSTVFILFGQPLVVLTYGGEYAGVESYIGWLAIVQMTRVVRVGPTIASLARGDTHTLLVSNVGRICVFPIAIWVALSGKPLVWIAIVGFIGEFVALLLTVWRLKRFYGLAIAHTLKPVMLGSGAAAGAWGISMMGPQTYPWSLPLATIILLALTCWNTSCRNRLCTLLHMRSPYVTPK